MRHETDTSSPWGTYEQLDVEYDPDQKAVWYHLAPHSRPCFNLDLLGELKDFQDRLVAMNRGGEGDPATLPVRYTVLASRTPGVFNLGGDLQLFAGLIRAQDRDGLFHYAKSCIDVLYPNTVNFDQPLLMAEMKRAGSELEFRGRRHLDAMRIFHRMERRDLTAAYRFYCDKELTGAHNALADTAATLEILDAQVGRYEEVPDEVEALHAFCNPDEGRFVDRTRKLVWNDQGEAEFTFGKYQGRSLNAVCEENRGYLEWMLNKDFSEEVKGILREALGGVFPRKDG